MTKARKLKRAIRARAAKTGERYTAARRQILAARTRRAGTTAPAAEAAPPPAPSGATRARAPRSVTSDRAVRAKTGHGFDHWFAVLDAFGAAGRGHTASARYLSEEHGVPGWHCQMITVEYERARGLRATNQTCAGDFQVSVSRTVPGTVEQVKRALSDARARRAFLRAADPALARALQAAFTGAKARGVTQNKAGYARLRYPWDGGVVELHIYAKPGGKVSLTAQNSKLSSPDEVERRRQLWRAALAHLDVLLAG
jgi:hypothetical protein